MAAFFDGAEAPQRCPDLFDRVGQRGFALYVGGGVIQTGAVEVGQIFGVGRRADKDALPRQVAVDPRRYRIQQGWVDRRVDDAAG